VNHHSKNPVSAAKLAGFNFYGDFRDMYIYAGQSALTLADRTEGVLGTTAEHPSHSSNATQRRRFQACAAESVAENILRAVRETRFLSREEERGLACAWRDKADVSSRDEIIEAHVPLVWNVARAARQTAVKKSAVAPAVEELVSEGVLALYQAITSFDPDAPNRFSSYAKRWVAGAIGRYINAQQSIVKGTAFDRIVDLPINAGDEPYGGVDPIDDGPSPEELVERSRQLQAVEDAISRLAPRERRVLEARRLADKSLTLERLSAEFGVSIERIRQIEACALKKVREWTRPRTLRSRRRAAIRPVPDQCLWPGGVGSADNAWPCAWTRDEVAKHVNRWPATRRWERRR
jgi:RNA polymerase sigma factor (sigma-70 family)